MEIFFFFLNLYERARETDRQAERQRQRETETDTERDREGDGCKRGGWEGRKKELAQHHWIRKTLKLYQTPKQNATVSLKLSLDSGCRTTALPVRHTAPRSKFPVGLSRGAANRRLRAGPRQRVPPPGAGNGSHKDRQ